MSAAPARPARAVAALERLRLEFGAEPAARKRALMRSLERAALPTAAAVRRLHEALCFVRAHPDDRRVLRLAERLLAGFERRADLAAHRARLADSGIAGTEIRYRFFQPMADWLAARWPERLSIDWEELERAGLLERLLPLLAPFAATPALDEYALDPREWVAILGGEPAHGAARSRTAGRRGAASERRRRAAGGAAWLVGAFRTLAADSFVRELLYDELDVPMRLAPGPGTPSRTRDRFRGARVAFQTRPLDRGRPDLAREVLRPPEAIRAAGRREAEELIDLARAAMVARQRDLDAFAHGDPRDVQRVDLGGGLELACIGVRPERRLLLESVHGWLTLKNGVPIGYVLTAALFRSAEVAYNVFDTFRGAEAAAHYARILAATRALLGAEAFTVPPYQLGAGNDEALDSGAWWFYRKLGFVPRDRAARALARREEARLRRDPRHRSSRRTLERLAGAPLVYPAGAPGDVLGLLPLPEVGLHAARFVARRFGGDRDLATAACTEAAAARLGIRLRGLSAGERLALERWSPLVMSLPGLARWSAAERRAAGRVVLAKGGRRESDFVRAFDRHARLHEAVRRLALGRRRRAT